MRDASCLGGFVLLTAPTSARGRRQNAEQPSAGCGLGGKGGRVIEDLFGSPLFSMGNIISTIQKKQFIRGAY